VGSRTARIAFVFILSLFAFRSEANAEGGHLIEKTTGTSFNATTQEGGHRFKCLGTGVRKLLMAKVYALAFYVDAAHADALVKSYLEAHHAGMQGDPLFDVLRGDSRFFDMLAGTERNRLVVLEMQRDVSRRQLAGTIRRSLSPLLPKEKLDRLDAAITRGADKGQVVKISAVGPKLTVDVAGEVRVIEDEDVTRNLFFVWLGTDGVSPSLREDIARRAARVP
jgi:hypothetical protein